MSARPIRVLLLEDNPGDARLEREALAEHAPGEFDVVWVESISFALERLSAERFDVILCDLGLPGSTGLSTARTLAARAPTLPLVVLTGTHSEDLGNQAIREGAQDYLVKDEASGPLIAHALRYAIERKRLEVRLRCANQELERRVAERTAELEQRVKERTHALEIANRELEAFSYSVSHDLRTPLRTINGFAQLLEQQCLPRLDADCGGFIARIRAGSERMGHLIEDLLKLSRLSRQPLERSSVDLSALAQGLSTELAAEDAARRVEWSIAPGVHAQGDPGLLEIVLQNLLGNAWKYSSKREAARIEFGVSEQRGRPAFFVRDNGVGFDMKSSDKLFGAFQRLHSEAEYPGSGIGLATVARIVHRHGGEVWAESAAGDGATFYFTLDSRAEIPDSSLPACASAQACTGRIAS